MKRFFRILSFAIKLFLATVVAEMIKLFNKKSRNIWIIAERGDDARDNGYFFFKYMRENHPEQRIVYVIAKESSDAAKVEAIGEYVDFQSLMHFVFYALSTIRISSHSWGGDLPYADYFQKEKWLIDKRKKVIFLQHGVIKDDLPSLYAENNPVDMFVCGAKPEYSFVDSAFHYKKGVVRYTGLARYDNLHNNRTKNQILIMPTFRRWLSGKENGIVKNSTYVQQWNGVINNTRLFSILEEYDLELIFYPHYSMQPYIDLFKSTSKRITIARFADYDVQTLLIESKLLITDFSSVFFDFGYMEKPVIYFNFDKEEYIKKHYDFTKGYFSYEKNGFGRVVYQENDLVNEVIRVIENGFVIDESYRERTNQFFELKDQENCKRIFERILEIESE